MNYALSLLSRFGGDAPAAIVNGASKPLCNVVDLLLQKLVPAHEPAGESRPLDVDTLLTILAQSWNGHSIHPVYDRHSLQWLLTLMRDAEARGHLRSMAVHDETGKPIGCYIYYARQGGVGQVVYLNARPPFVDVILHHLFYDAARLGVIALHGKLDPATAPRLSKRLCFFFDGHDPLLVHSRRRELIGLVQRNATLWTRLDGEWCLKFGFDSLEDGQRAKDPVHSEERHVSAVA